MTSIATQMLQKLGNPLHPTFFQKYSGLNLLLGCSYDSRFQEKTDKPPFYEEYWTIFKELRNLYNCDNGHDLILSNNSEVLLEGNSFFSRNWRDKGVITVQDILGDNRIPLTLYTLTSLCIFSTLISIHSLRF